MIRIFEKARRWHDTGTEAYGTTLLLQVTTILLVLSLALVLFIAFFLLGSLS
jgi:uncharacterized membrane protein YhaH (DUF805 family)